MMPPFITPILGSRLTRPNDLLSLLKTPNRRENLEIFASPTYRREHEHDSFCCPCSNLHKAEKDWRFSRAGSRATSLRWQYYCLPRGRRSASSPRASSRMRLGRRHAPHCPHQIALNSFLSKDNENALASLECRRRLFGRHAGRARLPAQAPQCLRGFVLAIIGHLVLSRCARS
jgi:hypothetical protein